MSNNRENGIIVDGFAFTEEEQAKQAQKESKGVAYVKGKTDMDNPRMVLQIYNKMVEQRLFETVVGYVYLKELQDYLTTIPFIDQNAILAIPVIEQTAVPEKRKNPRKKSTGKNQENVKLRQPQEAYQSRGRAQAWELRAKIMTGVCIVLALCVVGMFIIQTTAGSVNILNYENELINKYEAWEEQLEEREAAVKELEKEYGISTQGYNKED